MSSQNKKVLPNQLYGELTISHIVYKSRFCTQWSCKCNCGNTAIRSSNRLLRLLKFKKSIACDDCNQETKRGYLHAALESKKIKYRELWKEHQSLYTDQDYEWLTTKIKQDLETEFGFIEDLPTMEDMFTRIEYNVFTEYQQNQILKSHHIQMEEARKERRTREKYEAKNRSKTQKEKIINKAIIASHDQEKHATILANQDALKHLAAIQLDVPTPSKKCKSRQSKQSNVLDLDSK
jgi:hypothetical protein